MIQLSQKYIEDGKELIRLLDKRVFKIRFAFWTYNMESKEWHLIIASQYVDENGQLKLYSFIRSLITQSKYPFDIRLRNISVIGTSNDIEKKIDEDYNNHVYIKNYENIIN